MPLKIQTFRVGSRFGLFSESTQDPISYTLNWEWAGTSFGTTPSTNPLMTVDHAEFNERIQAPDPKAVQAVAHKYLQQILRAARTAGLPPNAPER